MKSFPRMHSMDEHVKSVNIVNILPLLSMRQNSFGVDSVCDKIVYTYDQHVQFVHAIIFENYSKILGSHII
jgi:hypothetical protein